MKRSAPRGRFGGSVARTLRPPAWLALAALASLAACSPTPAPDRPRLLVLVILDTLAAGHVSHLGYERRTTPGLDALAADGIAFESAVTPATYTVAAVPSLFTGQLPDRHGVTDYDKRLSAQTTTLTELLSAAGYSTTGMTANSSAGPRYGNERGFQEFIEVYLGPAPEGAIQVEHRGQMIHLATADEFLPLVRERLERLEADESLFLYLHLREPHGPYDPPLEFKLHFVDERTPHPYQEGDRARLRASNRDVDQPTDEVIAEIQRLYDANVLWADHNLAAILDELRARGLYEEALIVVTSDHGEAFWQHHGISGHGHGLYEEEARVPLIVKLPAGQGAEPGSRVGVVASLLDVLPTLGELLDLRAPPGVLDGRSLRPYLLDPGAPDDGRRVLLRTYDRVGLFGLRSTREKLMARVEEVEGELRASELRFYDLAHDPLEQVDLSAQDPERTDAWTRELLARLKALGEDRIPVIRTEPSGLELELLEMLGYVGGEHGGELGGAGDR